MSNIQKLSKPFVYVDDENIDTFVSKYLNYEYEIFGESDKYNSSIVFLGSTGQIATHGQIFGSNEVFIGDVSNAPNSAKILIDSQEPASNIQIYTKQDIDAKIIDLRVKVVNTPALISQIHKNSKGEYFLDDNTVYDFGTLTDTLMIGGWTNSYQEITIYFTLPPQPTDESGNTLPFDDNKFQNGSVSISNIFKTIGGINFEYGNSYVISICNNILITDKLD